MKDYRDNMLLIKYNKIDKVSCGTWTLENWDTFKYLNLIASRIFLKLGIYGSVFNSLMIVGYCQS